MVTVRHLCIHLKGVYLWLREESGYLPKFSPALSELLTNLLNPHLLIRTHKMNIIVKAVFYTCHHIYTYWRLEWVNQSGVDPSEINWSVARTEVDWIGLFF